MIIDTHLHVIDPGLLRYPWLAHAPALAGAFPYQAYATEARRLGITTALHMEADVAENQIELETDNVTALADRPDALIVGAIAACRPESPDFAGYLERARANPIVKGFRRVLHVMPDGLSEQPLFGDNIRRLAGTGLTFDLVVRPHQLEKVIALIDLAPDVQFVLDHCGNPDIRAGGQGLWRSQMSELARRPNITGKISGIVVNTDMENWVLETLRPYVEYVIACFGWDRVIWGSDWPVCTMAGSLSTWVAATHALIAGASAGEKAGLLRENARRLWSLA